MKQSHYNKRMKKRSEQHYILERRSKDIACKSNKKQLTEL